jgi:cyanophycin synthetase
MPLSINDHLIIEEARSRGYLVEVVSEAHPLTKISKGDKFVFFRKMLIWTTKGIAKYIAEHKDLSYIVLENLGFSIPKTETVFSETEALSAAAKIGYPLVVKPNDSLGAQGVSILFQEDEVALRVAYQEAVEVNHSAVLVQRFFKGKDYRVFILEKKVVAVAYRVPARVFGDGYSTIQELIEKENQNPLRGGKGRDNVLTQIAIDDDIKAHLARQQFTLQSIPLRNEEILLREIGSASTGGESIDLTDELPLQNQELFERIATSLDAAVMGLDIRCNDITQPLSSDEYCVIEINHSPGFSIHHFPSQGKPRNIAKMVVDLLPF